MIKRRIGWMGAVAATACLSASVLFARQGVVKTRDGRTLEGDVEEKPDQVIVNLHGIKTAVNRDNVDGPVQYFDNAEDRYQAKVAALPKKPTAADRLAIARWAYDARAYDIAQREIDEARKLDPNSAEAATLEQTVMSQRRLDRARPGNTGATGTPAAPRPPAAGGNTTPPPAAAAAGEHKLLTPEDINVIRRVEWRETDTTVPRATVPPNVRKRYVELKALDPGRFAALTLPQQAYYILSDPAAPEELKGQIKLTTDPQAIADYRRTIQPLVLNNCATAGCHQAGVKHPADFALFTNNPDREDVAYTNFYILQKYKHTFKQDDKRYSMVDRTYPDRSILAEFALSPEASELRHPEIKGQTYKPMATGRSSPAYKTIVLWMKELQAGEPIYHIDYPVPGSDDEKGAATPPPDKAAPPAAATPSTPTKAPRPRPRRRVTPPRSNRTGSSVMSPVVLLIAVVGVTVAAAVVDALIDRARRARLAALASTWGMRFTPDDRFQLTPRIAARFPTPGAADVVVRDLMYTEDGPSAFRYLFTVEYTVGVLRTKRRRLGVGTVREATRAGGGGAEPFSDITLAPRDLPMTQQYEWLRARTTPAESQ